MRSGERPLPSLAFERGFGSANGRTGRCRSRDFDERQCRMDKLVVVLEVGGRDSEEALNAGVIILIEKWSVLEHVKQTK